MGIRWRRAFCTRDPESTLSGEQHRSTSPSPSPKSYARLGFMSKPSTPRLQKQQSQPASTSSLRCEDSLGFRSKSTPSKSPKTISTSNPASPRSPLKLSFFKNSFKFRSSCGICLNSVKTEQGKAIYTAECGHDFHFPCIADHVRNRGSLVCPVCNANWKDVPLLAAQKNNLATESPSQNDAVAVLEPSKHVVPPQQQQQQPKHSDSIRSYNDDEPLLSSTSAAGIMPIPEGDENDEEDEDEDDDASEFRGFFVNPKRSSSVDKNDGDSRCVKVKLMPECAVVSVSRSHETYALALRVKAPPPPPAAPARSGGGNSATPSQRAPIDLVTVLDVGGSMTGAKLHMLKHAMRLVIAGLGSADRLSIVAFSATSKRLLPLRRMTAQGQREARRIVDRLVCHHGTCVGDALKKATRVLEDRREKNPVASVMLLSDGHEERVQTGNSTHQRQYSSHVSSTRFAHIEIPVHAFGFGAKRGHYHEPAEDAFAKCVGGLLSVVVQDLRIQLGFQSNSAAAEISAIYLCSARPTALSSGAVRLGDLYAEEERELLVELKVPASALGSHHLMTVRCLYKDPVCQEIVYGREQGVLVPPPQSARCSGTRIERLRNVFITTRAIAESRRLVEQNELSSALHLLASARALLMQSGSNSAEEYVRGLETELAELQGRRQQQHQVEQQMVVMQRRRGSQREMSLVVEENGEPLTPTSAWRAAERLAKLAMTKKSLNRVRDLHGFEDARF